MICPNCNEKTCCGRRRAALNPDEITNAAEVLQRAQRKEWFGTDIVELVDDIEELSYEYPRVAEFLSRIADDYRTEYAKHYNRE